MRLVLLLALLASAGGCASTPLFRDCSTCPIMRVIPAGEVEVGRLRAEADDEEYPGPIHAVSVAAFAAAKYEVSVGEFARFVADTGYTASAGCNVYGEELSWYVDFARNWRMPGYEQSRDEPVVCVSWNDAQEYAAWLGAQTGLRFRLLSEAEWEYLARLGGLSASHGQANVGLPQCCGGAVEDADRWMYTAPVGSFGADAFGLFDVRGNVWEWQQDCYHFNYQGAPSTGAPRITDCSNPERRAVRGGSWGDGGDFLDPSFRLRAPADQGYFTLGFRLARDLR